uniref:Alpha-1,3-mannosyl-glycoprotein 2-beta-N-acetylglucosaminyltransferase n=1 Tax=Caenorhabditis tropicalis TaxID=1561998 RepID=A0A1I7TQG2_9PELO
MEDIYWRENIDSVGVFFELSLVCLREAWENSEFESHGLVEWLDAVPTGYIVAVVSFDEASNQLSDMARRIFYEMGSSMIDRLKFRASWYFVGQKGIGAYTPFEDLNIPQGNNWANPIQTSFCLPKSLHKWAGRKDTSPIASSTASDGRNLPKRHFCAKYDRHEEFCSGSNIDSPIMPRHLHDEQRANDAIFNVPILVASGLAPDSLRITLESLLMQEGLNTQMVLVTYDKEYSENADLAALFHVKSVAIQSNGSYNAHLLLSLSNAFSIFPDASSVIVIEEDVTLSQDYLQYFSSIYEPYKSDSHVDLALAFNSNGFNDTSGDGQTVYRIKNHLPIGSYLMKRELYEKHIRLREFCCTERGNWDLRDSTALVPGLSRIQIRVDELEKQNTLFRRDRIHSQNQHLINAEFETSDEYSTYLNQLIHNTKKSIPISDIISIGCDQWTAHLDTNSLKSILLTFSKKSEVESLFDCLKMYITPKILRSTSVFRFTLNQSTEVIVVAENLKID